jgi:hypothetical protein
VCPICAITYHGPSPIANSRLANVRRSECDVRLGIGSTPDFTSAPFARSTAGVRIRRRMLLGDWCDPSDQTMRIGERPGRDPG